MNTISIQALDFEMTDAIRGYMETRVSALHKAVGLGSATLEARIRRETPNHHRQGEHVYHVDMTLRDAGKVWRADANRADVYAAIDEVKDDLVQLVRRDSDTKRSLFRRGAAQFKKMLHGE